jgi:predicted glycosyltransferase
VKLVVPVRAEVDQLPLVTRLPLQPSSAVQLLAFVEVQLSVELPPSTTDSGLAVSVSVGGGGGGRTVTVTLLEIEPPLPEQTSV